LHAIRMAVILVYVLPQLALGQMGLAANLKAEQTPRVEQTEGTARAASQAKPQPKSPHSGRQGIRPASGAVEKKKPGDRGRQTNRILWVAPNFAAVSSDTQLPPLTTKAKFKLASQDSFDYTGFVWTGILAAQSYAMDQYPEFGHGAMAYGRYYWRGLIDGTSGTYFTEAIVPVLTHEDPRYYTLGHGGFFRRFGYALSRAVVTKTDSGGTSFNFSEVGGNALEAGLSNAYYPPEERGLTKTAENWGAQMESAALNNIAKEFWPDFRRRVLRQK
jgi:hypothetical protein